MVIRQQVKKALDEVADLGTQPRAAKNGFGLVIKMPTGRTRALVDGSGTRIRFSFNIGKSHDATSSW